MHARPQIFALSLCLACLFLLAACRGEGNGSFQGYVEGDYVYLASARAGRLDRLAAGSDADDIADQFLDLILPALADQLQHIADILVIDLLTLCSERQEAGNCLFRQEDVLSFSADMEHVFPVQDFYTELRFEYSEILIKRTEDVDNVFNPFNLDYFIYHSQFFLKI